MRKSLPHIIPRACACLIFACTCSSTSADDFDEFFKSAQKEFDDFKKTNEKEFEDFRQKINDEMLEFMKNPWIEIRPEKPAPVPEEPRPIVIDYDDKAEKEKENNNPPKPEPRPIQQTITPPKPKPQPQPVAPVIIKEPPVKTTTVRMYGTEFTIPCTELPKITISGNLNDNIIRQNYSKLIKAKTDNLLKACLDARKQNSLCDWAYIKLLEKVAEHHYGKDNNASRLLWAFLMQQSGYSIRLGYNNAQFYPLFESDDFIYQLNYFFIDGKMFFVLNNIVTNLYFCNFKYPGEQAVSMAINELPLLTETKATTRDITVNSYPDIKLSVSVNKNLIDFYNEFPQSTIGLDPYAKWALYANVPATPQLKAIYPTLRNAIRGKNQHDAASILLKVAQSFPYGFDDEIWGGDRAFFPDESWYYPKSDCEDHAIHFSRLVRDLMGLDVALVYYPGHLSAAVAFTDNTVSGDYVIHDGRPYTFCDATYFYAPVGKSAPSNDNSQAILIDLKN